MTEAGTFHWSVFVLYVRHQGTKISLSVEERLKRTHILLKRLFSEKLMVPHLVKTFSVLYGNLVHYITSLSLIKISAGIKGDYILLRPLFDCEMCRL